MIRDDGAVVPAFALNGGALLDRRTLDVSEEGAETEEHVDGDDGKPHELVFLWADVLGPHFAQGAIAEVKRCERDTYVVNRQMVRGYLTVALHTILHSLQRLQDLLS